MTSIGEFLGNIQTFFSSFAGFVTGLNQRDTWIRVALVILGIGLVLVALWEMST